MDGTESCVVNCRICQSARIQTILDFGLMPLANRYLKEPSKDTEIFVPLEVALCLECGCVQLRQIVNPNILFGGEYLYTSSTSGSLTQHFRDYAKDTALKLLLHPGSFVVGIGGNDGPLERAYKDLGYHVLNVEASKNIAEASRDNGVPTWNEWFTEEVAKSIVEEHGESDLITCNNCLAHIPNIHAFIRAVKVLLKPNGWFVTESAYWLNEVKGNHFDHIYHEHCFYWTIKALERLFRGHGLRIEDVELNSSQGGSIRVFARRDLNMPWDSPVNQCIKDEEKAALFSPTTYADWGKRIDDWKATCKSFLEPLDSICCYGVPAKFTMISEQLGFTPKDAFEGSDDIKILYAVEDSQIKVGRFTPGSHIPIVNRQYFIDNPPRYCIITASNYASLIISANPQFLGDWIVLLPEPSFL